MPEGASPTYHCFAYGQVINGVPIWFSVTHNGKTGFYASAFDDAHYRSDAELTQKYGVPKCGASSPAPGSNPAAPQPAPVVQPKPVPVAGYYSPFNRGERGDDGKVEDLVDQGRYFNRVGGWSGGRLGPPFLIRGMQKYDPNLLRSLDYPRRPHGAAMPSIGQQRHRRPVQLAPNVNHGRARVVAYHLDVQ
jgi:hypothetical protein